jgi:ADP-heptose:LPS heptosyltransferase
VIISRTDRIGDVVLTLPLAGALKTRLDRPVHVTFLGSRLTRDVVACCRHVDRFVAWEDIRENATEALRALGADVILHVFPQSEIATAARQAGIRQRVGTRNRWFHWRTCNRLLILSRRNSDRHESQLNLKFLEAFGLKRDFSLDEIAGLFGFAPTVPLPERLRALVQPDRINLVLHPRSNGSAREWGVANFTALCRHLPPERYRLFITGTEAERASCGELLAAAPPHVHDQMGQLTLPEFIALLAAADGTLANSTGTVHLSAALGKPTLGLYPTARPMHPGRWQPVGPAARALTGTETCAGCPTTGCTCVASIRVETVAAVLESLVYSGKKVA